MLPAVPLLSQRVAAPPVVRMFYVHRTRRRHVMSYATVEYTPTHTFPLPQTPQNPHLPPPNTHLAESVEDVGAVVGREEGALRVQAVDRVLSVSNV